MLGLATFSRISANKRILLISQRHLLSVANVTNLDTDMYTNPFPELSTLYRSKVYNFTS